MRYGVNKGRMTFEDVKEKILETVAKYPYLSTYGISQKVNIHNNTAYKILVELEKKSLVSSRKGHGKKNIIFYWFKK